MTSPLIGLTDIVLMFFVVRRMFKREALALVAAGMLALTPAHFMLSRHGVDYLYPIPLLLVWLLCLLTYLEHGRLRPPARDYIVAAAGVAVPLMFFVTWYLAHPTALADTANGNPTFVFLAGDLPVPFLTRGVGIFTLPVAVLLLVGIGFAMRHPSAPSVIALVGFFASSLAAVLAGKKTEIIYIATMLPFGVLLATMGVVALWRWPFLGRAHLVLMPAGLIVLVGGLISAARSLLTVGHLTGSIGPVVLTGAALCTMAFASDAVSITKIIAVLLVLAIPVEFSLGFERGEFGSPQVRRTDQPSSPK